MAKTIEKSVEGVDERFNESRNRSNRFPFVTMAHVKSDALNQDEENKYATVHEV